MIHSDGEHDQPVMMDGEGGQDQEVMITDDQAVLYDGAVQRLLLDQDQVNVPVTMTVGDALVSLSSPDEDLRLSDEAVRAPTINVCPKQLSLRGGSGSVETATCGTATRLSLRTEHSDHGHHQPGLTPATGEESQETTATVVLGNGDKTKTEANVELPVTAEAMQVGQVVAGFLGLFSGVNIFV